MRKLLNKPWFVAVLAFAAVLAVGRSLLPAAPASVRSRVARSLSPATAAVAVDEAVAAPRLSAREALAALAVAAAVRDPFAPRPKSMPAAAGRVAEPDVVDRMHLSAIWKQDGATWLLVNDRIVAVGDAVGRLRIESVTRDGVWVSHWKGRDFVALGGDFMLTTPADSSRTAASL